MKIMDNPQEDVKMKRVRVRVKVREVMQRLMNKS